MKRVTTTKGTRSWTTLILDYHYLPYFPCKTPVKAILWGFSADYVVCYVKVSK